jgi:hypothetical protein
MLGDFVSFEFFDCFRRRHEDQADVGVFGGIFAVLDAGGTERVTETFG